MCKWGDTTTVRVTVPVDLSHSGEERLKNAEVDSCIAPLVAALQLGGVSTRASCCGHGERPGSILLSDGRELLVVGSYAVARELGSPFPVGFHDDACPRHQLVQHRDRKRPWCNACGRDARGYVIGSRTSRFRSRDRNERRKSMSNAQTYDDPVAVARLDAGRCPECGSAPDAHTGWGGPGCSLTDNGVAQRLYARRQASA